MKSFRALLLTKCQEEFEKDKKDDEELDKLKQAMEEAQTVSLARVRGVIGVRPSSNVWYCGWEQGVHTYIHMYVQYATCHNKVSAIRTDVETGIQQI